MNNSNSSIHPTVTQWNDNYFKSQLSTECLCLLSEINFDNAKFIHFIETYFQYIADAGFDPKQLSPYAARIMAQHLESHHTSLWDIIPPITNSGRMRQIDRYYIDLLALDPDKSLSVLEIECGYPPYTLLESASKFTNWNFTGIDPNFPSTILYDDANNAACFNKNDEVTYIQYDLSKEAIQPHTSKINNDKIQFHQKLTNLSLRDKQSLIKLGKLIPDPKHQFERSNVSINISDLSHFQTTKQYHLIRCMNVLCYYSKPEIDTILEKVNVLLFENGYFVYGNVSETGGAIIFTVYKKTNGILKKHYFCFDSIKLSQHEYNGYWAYHPNLEDTSLLTKIIKSVSSNPILFGKINQLIDNFMTEHDYGYRDKEGYLHETTLLHFIPEYEQLNRLIGRQMGKEIIDEIKQLFQDSWIDEWGNITISLEKID